MVHSHFIRLELRFPFCETGGLNRTSASLTLPSPREVEEEVHFGGRGLKCSLKQLAESIAFFRCPIVVKSTHSSIQLSFYTIM